jgi:hypothetical protein
MARRQADTAFVAFGSSYKKCESAFLYYWIGWAEEESQAFGTNNIMAAHDKKSTAQDPTSRSFNR